MIAPPRWGTLLSLALLLTISINTPRGMAFSSDEYRHVAGILGHRANLSTHHTNHFTVIHTADARWAGQAGRLLEHTRERFYRTFAQAGFGLQQPTQKLVWVCLPDRRLFDRYTVGADGMAMHWLDGYYSAKTNRVALLLDDAASARGDSRSRQNWADGIHASPVTASDRFLAPEQAWVHGFTDVARARHEAAHQLAFNAGLQTRGVMYPLWATEGLACTFEYGDDDNPVRRARLLRLHAEGNMIPVDRFATFIRQPGDGFQINDLYAQSWGMFEFLLKYRPAQLRAYLEELSRTKPGYRDPTTMRHEFIRHFGLPQHLEAHWHHFIRELAQRPGQ